MNAMSTYIARRLLLMVPTIFGILLINFAIIQFVPGGPVERMVATTRQLAKVRGSEDLKEGIAAYKERRKPRFTGK